VSRRDATVEAGPDLTAIASFAELSVDPIVAADRATHVRCLPDALVLERWARHLLQPTLDALTGRRLDRRRKPRRAAGKPARQPPAAELILRRRIGRTRSTDAEAATVVSRADARVAFLRETRELAALEVQALLGELDDERDQETVAVDPDRRKGEREARPSRELCPQGRANAGRTYGRITKVARRAGRLIGLDPAGQHILVEVETGKRSLRVSREDGKGR
jgi:hypothetical protein